MKGALVLVLLIMHAWAWGQADKHCIIRESGIKFLNRVKGQRYHSKSQKLHFDVPSAEKCPVLTILPQTELDSLPCHVGYLNKDLWLFKNSNPANCDDVAGFLRESSLIEICYIEQRRTIEDTVANSITFEVWYTILLNGRQYYTDMKPSKLEFQMAYPNKQQRFTIFNQESGYDHSYDIGYPEFFRVLVFDESRLPMKLTFDSGVLDFKNGNEFWGSDNTGDFKTTITAKGLEFQLVGFGKDYKATWNGKALVDVELVDIE